MDKQSRILRTRIAECEQEITDSEARLIALLEEKATVLGAPLLDSKSARRLEAEMHALSSAVEAQHERIMLLQDQLEAAETEEAGQRVDAIEAEHQMLALTLSGQHQEWTELLVRLAAIFMESQEEKAKRQLLTDEAAYLHERYDTRWAHLPPVRVPARDDVTKVLEPSLQKASWRLLGSNTWKDQTAQLRQARNVAAAAGRDPRRMVRSQIVSSKPVIVVPGGDNAQRGVGSAK